MKFVEGGVCAAKGFQASGVHCGIRRNKSKKDLALILSDTRASAAAVYTTNLVKGAPIWVTQENLADGYAQAMICNSGNANTCNADGMEIARAMCALVEDTCGIPARDVIIASTGVIGQPLDLTPIREGMPALKVGLGQNSFDAAQAIMTTDLAMKELAVEFTLDGKTCHLGGIAKGSGMINPNMATMLVFLTTDAAISPEMLSLALKEDVPGTFNMICIDGDTSTNDMVSIMANGAAGNAPITERGADFDAFCDALNAVTARLCPAIAKDGEGATKLLECKVEGAADISQARIVSKGIISSALVKAAMFGADANWGRVLCAIGYSGTKVDVWNIDVDFSSPAGRVAVCKNGVGVPFSEEKAAEILAESEIGIHINLNAGQACATAWGCDLTYDYVKINGDYRT